MKRGRKKGISPVIATVLLIAMVVVVALIVFIWFRGMIGESATKFGKNIELVCDDVKFEASYSSPDINLVNIGNVPIFRVRLRIFKAGSHETVELDPSDDETGLKQGGAFSGSISGTSGASKITVFPVLIGESSKGRKTYVCEGQYGEEIVL